MEVGEEMYFYTGKLNSDIHKVGYDIQSILGKLAGVVSDEDLLFDIRLIVNELVINGCEHGNKSDDTKSIRLSLSVNENKITIQVVDEGEGMKYSLFDYNAKSMESSGRGLRIVSELTDELIIDNNRVIAIIHSKY